MISCAKGKSMKFPTVLMIKRRRYASYYDWPDKKIKELGIVKALIEAMLLNGNAFFRSPRVAIKDPPDCVAEDLAGGFVALEVPELVSEDAVRENSRGNRVYWDADTGDVIAAIDEILQEKDRKKFQGGPYSRVVVVIHTAEPVVTYREFGPVLGKHVFPALKQLDEAYLLFSYDPSQKRAPHVRLRIADRKAS